MQRAQLPGHSKSFQRLRRMRGFTLIELMIVICVLLIIMSIAVPSYRTSIVRAKESVLRQQLFDLRKFISEYTLDKQKPPQSLDDLVQAGYLKEIPRDPISGSADWVPEQIDESTVMSPDDQGEEGGIDDVHCPSTQIGSDGTAYNTW
jgi:general secretion pathway protein G